MPRIFRSFLASLVLAVCWAVLPLLPAQAQDLEAALRATPPGGILELPAGDWGPLRLRGADGPSVIRSADPANPARISRMDVREVTNLTLKDLTLKYDWAVEDLGRIRPFEIIESQDIRLDGVRIIGDVAGGTDPTARGFPSGTGLSIQYSQDVTIQDSEITAFYRGIVVQGTDRVGILRNNIYGLRMDGLNFAMVRDVLIEGNQIHDFARSVNSNDHSDMIQFWTNRTDSPSTDITIRNNILNSGRGAFTQSIFMRNDQVDQGIAGREMFYRNIMIEGNLIINAHLHGITVGETDGLTIRSNTVVYNPNSAGEDPTRDLWLPQIRVSKNAENVTLERNIAASFPDTQSSWRVSKNVVAQPHKLLENGHYNSIFTGFPGGDPTQPRSYATRSGGPAAGTGVTGLQ